MFNKILIIMKRLFVFLALLVFSRLSFAQVYQYTKEVSFIGHCFIIEVNCGGIVPDPQTGGTKCVLDGNIYPSDCNGNPTGNPCTYHVERPVEPTQGVWRWATESDGVTDCQCYVGRFGVTGCKSWENLYNMTKHDFASLADQMHTCCGKSNCDTLTITYADSLCADLQVHCCNGKLNVKYSLYKCNDHSVVFIDEFSVDIIDDNMYSTDGYDNMQTVGEEHNVFSDEKRWSILQSYLEYCSDLSKEPCE